MVRVFSKASLQELVFRFEEPNSEARWHKPMFTTTSTGSVDAPDLSSTPLVELWNAVTTGDVQPPKAVTLVVGQGTDSQRKTTANNSLELLDAVTQSVVSCIRDARAQGQTWDQGLTLSPPDLPGPVLTLAPTPAAPTPARLQMLRRQFVRVYASKAEYANDLALTKEASPQRHLAELFLAWLNEALASRTQIC